MTSLIWLVPIALGMGAIALAAFLWSMRSGQYEDLDGAAERVLLDPTDQPLDTDHMSVAVERSSRRPERPRALN